ncbi:hypothetical protein B0D78_03265 [Pyramidobacter sp. C12-8]|nr:hypothetical protein B0D78_03265 [Pyramidobacter sp. C12-8]
MFNIIESHYCLYRFQPQSESDRTHFILCPCSAKSICVNERVGDELVLKHGIHDYAATAALILRRGGEKTDTVVLHCSGKDVFFSHSDVIFTMAMKFSNRLVPFARHV